MKKLNVEIPKQRLAVIKTVLCMLLSMLLVGCIGIPRPSTQILEVNSTPPGALAELSIGRSCVTPCSLVVPRKNDIDIKFSLHGYQDLTTTAKSRVDVVGAGSIMGNVWTGTAVISVAGAIAGLSAFGEAISGGTGGGVGPGVWVIAGAVCVYLVYASMRDAGQGKARSLLPNPVEVELVPVSPVTTSRKSSKNSR